MDKKARSKQDSQVTMDRALSWIIATAIASSAALIAYAIPRGLDITDESLYVLLAQAEPTLNISVIHTQLPFKLLRDILGLQLGIQDLRIGRAVFMALSCWFLGRVLQKEVRDPHTSRLIPMACISLGFMQYAGIGHIHALGYNSINWICGILSVAIAVRWIQSKNSVNLVIMGLLIFGSWISKFSAAVLLTGLTLVLFPLLSGRIQWRRWPKDIFLWLLSFAVILLLTSSEEHKILPHEIIEFVQNDTDTSHTTNRFLLNNVIWQIIIQYGALLPSVAFSWILQKTSLRRVHTTILHALTITMIASAILGFIVGRGEAVTTLYQAFWIAAGSLVGWMLPQCDDLWRRSIACMLTLTPLALTLGTNQPWLSHLLPLSLFPICGSLVLGAPRTVMLAAVVPPFFIASNMILHPYRQAPLTECTQFIHIPATNDSVLVTPAVHSYLEAHKTLSENYPYPLVGTDRNCGEILMTATPTCSQILWSKMQWSTLHNTSWNQYDTLHIGICNTEELPFFQDQLSNYDWIPTAGIARSAVLIETNRWGPNVPATRSMVQYFLLTKKRD